MVVEWLSGGLAKEIFIDYVRLCKFKYLSSLGLWNSASTSFYLQGS